MKRDDKLLRGYFSDVHSHLRDAVKAKDAYREQLAKLDKQKQTFTKEHLDGERVKAKDALNAEYAKIHGKITPNLDLLQARLTEANSQLDLSDPALGNALNIIKAIGANMQSDDVKRINAQFAYNQPALKILQAAYKAAGVTYDGGLDKQVYNVGDQINNLRAFAREALTRDDSAVTLNAVAHELRKFAALEGFDFSSTVDETGATEVMRAAAGFAA